MNKHRKDPPALSSSDHKYISLLPCTARYAPYSPEDGPQMGGKNVGAC